MSDVEAHSLYIFMSHSCALVSLESNRVPLPCCEFGSTHVPAAAQLGILHASKQASSYFEI